VVDPELGINVVDLGLVYGVDVDAQRIATIDMTTDQRAACPLTGRDRGPGPGRRWDGLVADFRIKLGMDAARGARRTSPRTGREQLRAPGLQHLGGSA